MPAAPDFPPASDRAPIKRALISVSDKTGLIEAAKTLVEQGVSVIATDAPLAVMSVLRPQVEAAARCPR